MFASRHERYEIWQWRHEGQIKIHYAKSWTKRPNNTDGEPNKKESKLSESQLRCKRKQSTDNI